MSAVGGSLTGAPLDAVAGPQAVHRTGLQRVVATVTPPPGSGVTDPGRIPAVSVARSYPTRVVATDPVSAGASAHQEASQDPLRGSAGGAWLGVGPKARPFMSDL